MLQKGFSVKQIDSKTWQIEETDTRMGVYFYLVVGEKKAMMIDTGLGGFNLKAIAAVLTDLPVEAINTHGHLDHSGGNGDFDKIYLFPEDKADYIKCARGESFIKPVRPVPEETIDLYDGEEFDLGGRTLRVIKTPGHSPGSCVVLDVEHRYLYTGDHCCRGEVMIMTNAASSVEEYRDSMQRVLDIYDQFDMSYPGHLDAQVGKDVLTRIWQLASDIVDGKVVGEERTGRMTYRVASDHEIAIAYRPDRVKR